MKNIGRLVLGGVLLATSLMGCGKGALDSIWVGTYTSQSQSDQLLVLKDDGLMVDFNFSTVNGRVESYSGTCTTGIVTTGAYAGSDALQCTDSLDGNHEFQIILDSVANTLIVKEQPLDLSYTYYGTYKK